MYSDNKQIRDVADVAAKIMYGQQPVTEKLHPNQQQLDVHEPEKDELTADDFKKLRAKKEVKKEEVEKIDEAFTELPSSTHGSYSVKSKVSNNKEGYHKKDYVGMDTLVHKGTVQHKDISKPTKFEIHNKPNGLHWQTNHSPEEKKAIAAHLTKHKYFSGKSFIGKDPARIHEEVEQIDEVKMADLPSTKVQGRSYGASKPEPHAVDTLRGPKEKELKDIEAEKKKKQKKFSEMVNLYQEKGLKSLSEMLVKEEPDNEQFTKELEDAKAKSEGKKRNTEIAKGAVQAVKQEGTEITDEMIFEVLENAGIDFESLSDDELQVVANEAYEILDELSKDTLKSYYKGSVESGMKAQHRATNTSMGGSDSEHKKNIADINKRVSGQDAVTKRLGSKETMSMDKEAGVSRLAKYKPTKPNPKKYSEEVEQIDEREMTDAEMKKREDIVKGMKKGIAGFKDRYGDRAKDVMYAAATKQAMK